MLTPFLRSVTPTRGPLTIRSFGTTSLKVDNPYSGETYYEVPLSSLKETNVLLSQAETAQKLWQHADLTHRIKVCEQFMSYFNKNREKIAKDITGQMGKPLKQSDNEINGMFERIKSMIKLAPDALKDEILPEKPGFFRKITKEPVGVVLCIAPWNYPLLTAVNTVIPAILAGNAVVLKHSFRTPLCGEVFAEAFLEAGVPRGLVTALHASHEVVNEAILHPAVGYVTFTGSVEGGQHIYRAVSKRFIDATLELGGKDPAYVAPDADIPAAVDSLIDGAFYNAGQSCCGVERIYVHKSKYDEFIEQSLKIVKGYTLGDPMSPGTTLGPMAQPDAPGFLSAQTAEAAIKGAKVLCGGHGCKDSTGHGRFFEPTLVRDVDHRMSLMVEESFGPIVGVAPVESDEEAVTRMNDSRYGLTASIFTNSEERANRLALKIQAGTVFMNRCDYLDPELPWTGVKDSGKGLSLSRHGFRGMTRMKAYHFKLPKK